VLPVDYHEYVAKIQKANNPMCNHLAKQGAKSNFEAATATARFQLHPNNMVTLRWIVGTRNLHFDMGDGEAGFHLLYSESFDL